MVSTVVIVFIVFIILVIMAAIVSVLMSPKKSPIPDVTGGIDIDKVDKVDKIDKVCLILGPYRNLTTLIVGVMALHPNIQVMNHGMKTLFDKTINPNTNFLTEVPSVYQD